MYYYYIILIYCGDLVLLLQTEKFTILQKFTNFTKVYNYKVHRGLTKVKIVKERKRSCYNLFYKKIRVCIKNMPEKEWAIQKAIFFSML